MLAVFFKTAHRATRWADASAIIEGFDKTLLAFADHGQVSQPIPPDGGDADEVLAQFQSAGIDTDALATRLQEEGKESFNKSWNDLLESIKSESRRLAATG